jgi:hypothetical protein
MSCEGVMMRMRNRTRNGAVGEKRLETGAHLRMMLIRTLLEASTRESDRRSSPLKMVDPSGIEPLTSCMPCRRSPS